MQVKLITKTVYEVQNMQGESLGDFVKADSWQGMQRLVNGVRTIIIEHDDKPLFDFLLPRDETIPVVVDVVKASENLHKYLVSPDKNKEPTT